MAYRKILKLASGISGYLLAIALGIILSTSAGKAAASSWSDILLAVALMAVLAHLSLGLNYLALKASPKRIIRALTLVLSGVVFAYLLDNLLSSGDLSTKRLIASAFYALTLGLIYLAQRTTESASAPGNLVQITLLSAMIYFIVFFEYQYELFRKAEHQLDDAIAYERHFTEQGRCFPTLANKNPEILGQYVGELEREEKKTNRHLPDSVTDHELSSTISQIAARHHVVIGDYTISRTMKEFYTSVDMALAVDGLPINIERFTDDIANDDMLVTWIRKPGDTEAKPRFGKFSEDYNVVFTTYNYLEYKDQSYKGSTRRCSFTPPQQPIRPLSTLLEKKQATYRNACNEKWADKAYTEMMLYAEKTKPHLIEKGHIISVLLDRAAQKQIKFSLDMPVCPRFRYARDK